MHCKSEKEAWEKIQVSYADDSKVKIDKIKNFRNRFNNLKVNDNEYIFSYLLRVDKVVNIIKGLGEYVKEELIVQKVLRSLIPKFDSKVSIIEEVKDLNTLNMDELHGTLTPYEMRVMDSKLAMKEISFKSENKTKDKKVKVDDGAHEVGHFYDKFPHRHDNKWNDDHKSDHEKKNHKYDKNKKEFKKVDFKKKSKKSFYINKEAYSFEEDSEANGSNFEFEYDHKDVGDEVLFMTKEAMRSSSGGFTLWGDLTPKSFKEDEGDDDCLRIELACVQS
ncbi:hypothetical protein KI387_043693 [Taxus chinensis]|uniref:UBN2 domain-containing protein n=1 Tax=Taxus chinensis TaxID=29808 RepID=A0AA38H0V9_TAXCH|nr:hypothetical protein KI387_043693 [Taxus chinensis]